MFKLFRGPSSERPKSCPAREATPQRRSIDIGGLDERILLHAALIKGFNEITAQIDALRRRSGS